MTVDSPYDPGWRLPWCYASGPGYHTRVPLGTRAHSTKEAADYAIALLQTGSAARAGEVLDALIALQVTDPLAEHYGLWGWFAEEPPSQMSPADWNWADFIGVRLAQVLVAHQLPEPLRSRVAAALRHAALSIFRRNVGPDYTNIAVMGAVTTAAAGEVLGDAALLDYARRRLSAVVKLRERIGGFTEYNSPSYHRVVLEELERAELIVQDGQFRALAAQLRELTWKSLAERFHPGTGQLAGPISRAYSDRLPPELTAYFTGLPVEGALVPPIPCPAHLVERFRALPSSPVEVVSRFSDDVTGTTWLTEDACLGSADEEFAWTQRRPLLGYWRTEEDPAVVLRAQMLLNGHDLSAAWCRQAQQSNRLLSAWWLSYDSGDFHPVLDKPEGSVFRVSDLRLIVSLQGEGIQVTTLDPGRFALIAGSHKAVVHAAPVEFLNRAIAWNATEAGVEAVLYEGPAHDVDFHDAVLHGAFALELLMSGEAAADHDVLMSNVDGWVDWRWGNLAVSTPARPTKFGYLRENR